MIDFFSVKKPWPWQLHGVEDVAALCGKGVSTCLQSPTGGGKSKMMWALIAWARSLNQRVGLLTNRNSLCRQLSRDMTEAGLDHGVVGFQFKEQFDLSKPIQLMMVQSEVSQAKRRKPTEVDMLLVDEAHLFQSGKPAELIQYHKDNGAYIVQVTATPVGLARTCEHIVIAGTNSQLREHGAHVPCLVRAPCEIDCDKVARTVTGEFKTGEVVKRVWSQQVVGKIFDHWEVSNPNHNATICFAPDCASSLWLAQEFEKRGVSVAHVEAGKVYWDGQVRVDRDAELRHTIFDLVKKGEISVLFNRFVCREGLDFPNLEHAILATPIGTLKSYVQTVGRLLRWSPQTPEFVHMNDHGGNIWRHGSPNQDRDWKDLFHKTERQLYKEERERQKKPKEDDKPIICPNCGRVRASGDRCPEPPFGCGHECKERQRIVVQADGTLRDINEREMTRSKPKEISDVQRRWDSLYWGQVKYGKTNVKFSQLRIFYHYKYKEWPPFNLHNMPRDWHTHKDSYVKELGREHLV